MSERPFPRYVAAARRWPYPLCRPTAAAYYGVVLRYADRLDGTGAEVRRCEHHHRTGDTARRCMDKRRSA